MSGRTLGLSFGITLALLGTVQEGAVGQTTDLGKPDIVLGLAGGEGALGIAVDCASIGEDTILVLDGFLREIVVFNLAGEYEFRFGRKGQGPGEFQTPESIEVWGNWILVSDSTLQRISAFDRKGQFVRSVGIPAPVRGMAVLGNSLYVATHSFENILWEIRLPELSGPRPVLDWNDLQVSKVETVHRMAPPLVARLGEYVCVGMPGIGMLIVMNSNCEIIAKTTVNDETTQAYLDFYQKRERETAGSTRVPNIFLGLAPISNKDLLVQLQVASDSGIPATFVAIDPVSGEEAQRQWLANGPGFAYLTALDNGLVALSAFADSQVYLYKVGRLQTRR